MFDIRGMKILGLAVLVLGSSITTTGCMSHVTESRQRIVSRSAYSRPPALLGRRGEHGTVRIGGSAEYSLHGKDVEATAPDTGGHLVPTGQAQGFVAVQLGRNFELGISAGAFLQETRSSRALQPVPLKDGPLFTGSIEGRAILGRRVQTSINFGARLSQIDYSWDFVDVCTGSTCPFSVDAGGNLNETTFSPSFFAGVSVDIPLNDRISVLLGGSFEAMQSFEEQRVGTEVCTGGFCAGDIPSKPPTPELAIGMVAFAGLNIYVTEGLRARLLVQPVAFQPRGVTQYLVTQGGLEYSF